MGNSLSSWGGQKKVQSLINKSGLPLQIDNSDDDDDSKRPLSTFTEAYPASGWFTGVKSAITIKKPIDEVYESLAHDLQKVFTPMSECDDDIQEDDGAGRQTIFRVVRIPFKVAFVTGTLKLRLNVKQDKQAGKIHFESAKEGRLITRFIADFEILTSPDRPEETIVKLDSKVNCKSLPPPPFKNMVKDVMVRKMDSCMVDLLNYHSQSHESDDEDFESASEGSVKADEVEPELQPAKSRYTGFMDMVRSFSQPLRTSLELFDQRRSGVGARRSGLQDTAHEGFGQAPASLSSSEVAGLPPVVSQSALYQPSSSVRPSNPESGPTKIASDSAPQSVSGIHKQSQASVFAQWQDKQ